MVTAVESAAFVRRGRRFKSSTAPLSQAVARGVAGGRDARDLPRRRGQMEASLAGRVDAHYEHKRLLAPQFGGDMHPFMLEGASTRSPESAESGCRRARDAGMGP